MTIRFFGGNLSYAEGELITIDDYKKYKIKITGNSNDHDNIGNNTTEIKFFDVQTDVKNIGSISVLMKRPEIKIINKDDQTYLERQLREGTTAVSFKRDPSNDNPVKIPKVSGNITSKLDYVDNYDESYHDSIKTQFVTYLNQNFQIINGDGSVINPSEYDGGKVEIQLPGDISEYAKEHAIAVPWREAISSTNGIILSLSISGVTIILIILSWLKIEKLSRKS
jgi:hypothetical protein